MRNIFYKKMARQAVINTGVHKVSKRRGLLQKRNVASWLEAPPTNILNNVLFELHLSNTIRRGSGILPRFSRILKRPITQPLGIRNRLNAFLSAEVLVQDPASMRDFTSVYIKVKVFNKRWKQSKNTKPAFKALDLVRWQGLSRFESGAYTKYVSISNRLVTQPAGKR